MVVANLPNYVMHGWRYIAFGPDGKLYVAVGANCNVCEHKDDLNATIIRMNPDGSEREIYARGVRNSVGMDWSPDGDLWFTDNGRDMLGNDISSDELNHAPVKDLDFGFPVCHSGSIPDPDLGSNESYQCNEKMPPAWALEPQVAPLGMRFYQGNMFPAEYQNKVFNCRTRILEPRHAHRIPIGHSKCREQYGRRSRGLCRGLVTGRQSLGKTS